MGNSNDKLLLLQTLTDRNDGTPTRSLSRVSQPVCPRKKRNRWRELEESSPSFVNRPIYKLLTTHSWDFLRSQKARQLHATRPEASPSPSESSIQAFGPNQHQFLPLQPNQ